MYPPMLIVHIAAGITALVSGYLALFVEKGSRLHRSSGNIFVVSMIFMGGFGAVVAITLGQTLNAVGGMLACYLVLSGWLTMQRKGPAVQRAEIGALVFALCVAAGLFALGWYKLRPGYVAKPMEGATACFIFAAIFLLFATADLRVLLRGGVAGAQRLVRHLWRMCFGLFAASGSFFLGRSSTEPLRSSGLRAKIFTDAVQATRLPTIPVLLILVMMVYWIVRVRRTKTYKRIPSRRAEAQQPIRSAA
jgi:uncharacterized membrane protein